MRVCVIGAGITGVATAYFLARDGHDVTVLDRHESPGRGASFANGAQLSYSYVAPLAAPGIFGKLPGWILKRASPLRFVPALEIRQWQWCLQFLRACRTRVVHQVTAELLALGDLSRGALQEIMSLERVAFDHRRSGKLVIYRRAGELEQAIRQAEYQRSLGCVHEVLSAKACIELESSLDGPISRELAGGIFTPSEEVGDCHKLVVELSRVLAAKYKVSFVLGAKVKALHAARRRIVSVSMTPHGQIDADAFVIAAGIGSGELLRPLGIRLPIYPLCGYSLTIPVSAEHRPPKVSITDADRKIVFASVGDRFRVAGMVDLRSARPQPAPERARQLLEWARSSFPRAGDYLRAESWFGLRPATPRSTPLLGAATHENLFLNTGHGALGFTLACGSARLVASQIFPSRIERTGYASQPL